MYATGVVSSALDAKTSNPDNSIRLGCSEKLRLVDACNDTLVYPIIEAVIVEPLETLPIVKLPLLSVAEPLFVPSTITFT